MATYVRFECGREDRMSKDYGPFEYVQLTYNVLRVAASNSDDTDFAFLHKPSPGGDVAWVITASDAIDVEATTGIKIDPKDVGFRWSDIVIFGQ